jgi:hypothetical protein
MKAVIILYACIIFQVFCLSVYAVNMPIYTRTDYPTTGGAAYMHVGKENNDAYPDLIVISPESNINVLPGGPEGVFGTSVVTVTVLPYLKMTVADDFNNDGFTDIFLNDTLFFATGNGEFAESKSLGIENLQTISSSDMNGDGNKDLIAIAIVYTDSTTRAAELRTYFGIGDGTFGEPVRTRIIFTDQDPEESGKVIDEYGTYHLFYMGDFTGDGVPDIVLRHTYYVEWHEITQDFTYIGSVDGTFSNRYWYFNGHSYIVEVKDINSDGIRDILDGGWIFLGDNTGAFHYLQQQIDIDFGSGIFSLADVNGDGIPDLALVKMVTGQPYGLLSTIRGTGNGSFGERYEFSVSLPGFGSTYGYGWMYETDKVLSYDFNQDRCADFVIPCYGTSNIAVVLSGKNTSVHVENILSPPVLFQNSPNPFNASTTIYYSIYHPGMYELAIYDVLGRKIMTIINGFQSNGEHSVVWNGKEENGTESASGFYFYTLKEKGGKRAIISKRLLYMK